MRFVTADVFTDRPFGGNQLAVFPDARGLDDARMLAITREFNFSETTFVFPPEDPSHTRRVRIFTPGGEVPFAGHPTVGTAHVLAALGEIPLTGDETHIVFGLNVGPVPVRIVAERGTPLFCQLSVAKLPEVGPPPPTRATLAAILGLEVSDLLGGAMTPQAVSCGLPFLLVPVKDRKALAKARLRLEAWETTLANWWAPEVFVFTRDGCDTGFDVHARMFGPGVAVPEDPATGSACAALGGYLALKDGRADAALRWTVAQGIEMGRPSRIEVEADKAGGAVTAVRVGGRSVIVTRGELLA
jgi:trans-2,3-dihydro-3-hydroxyanthranilate isomerase